jgi:hypothetical protein
MNRSELIEMIRNHSWSDSSDSAELKEIISLYPWFQSVYTLLLDAQYSADSLTFEESLKKNSVFVANREVLYYILKDSRASDKIQLEEGAENKTEVDDQGLRSREELVRQIESRLAELEDSSGRDISSSGDSPATVDIDYTADNEDIPEDNGIFLLDEDEDIVEGFENEIKSESEGVERDLLDLDYTETELSDSTASSSNDLVDRFIELNPRIEPMREKLDTPIEDIAEKIEDKNPGLITETLARIYINQKFYTKAILIYEKLSLKFPEKSSYFATQIEKIKELMS